MAIHLRDDVIFDVLTELDVDVVGVDWHVGRLEHPYSAS